MGIPSGACQTYSSGLVFKYLQSKSFQSLALWPSVAGRGEKGMEPKSGTGITSPQHFGICLKF